MSFTLFVLRILPVYWYCKVSIAMLSFNSSTDLSTLHWDFSIVRVYEPPPDYRHLQSHLSGNGHPYRSVKTWSCR